MLELVFRGSSPAVNVHLSPHLRLTVAAPLQPWARPAPPASVTGAPSAEQRQADSLVPRLVARAVRVDSVRAHDEAEVGHERAPSGSSIATREPAGRAVERTMRRTALTVAPELTTAARPEATRRTEPERQPWPAWPPRPDVLPPAAAPAVDINRLTDQVMQTIDRRIVAQRERLGRA
jgi:hypothetical protein